MGRIEELTSIKDKIKGELSSFTVGYLEELANELSDYMFDHWDTDDEEDNDLEDAAGELGTMLEDFVACFEDAQAALEKLEDLLSKLNYDKYRN
jgi:hypothetical protein